MCQIYAFIDGPIWGTFERTVRRAALMDVTLSPQSHSGI